MDPRPTSPLLFPYSPTQEEWNALDERQRRRYYDSIPQNPDFSAAPPEGVAHDTAQSYAVEALRQYFRKRGRKVFIARNLRVIYPREPPFDPDVLAVLDFPAHPRLSELGAWMVAQEGRGIDFALEVHVFGDRQKDATQNVERYARLGIPEYFMFDRPQRRLFGWRLPAAGATTYRQLLPQGGRLRSEILDLDLGIVDGQLRLFSGSAELPDSSQLIDRLDDLVEQLEVHLNQKERDLRAEEARRDEEEARRKDEEARRLEAERRVAELEAELERIKSGGK